ncbi:heterokaryon incompatibility protein-domain-containing protein [Stachybotrys elegans]|uniref:Heterokaryon incompatibility protein-domain-containing protein n=1 Tax=Stachybotrys elegans TaxID=80388 RepID=A0A8K0WT59_9HYPO|nr:heterokaryon incompatibility protein-domain-containing protein [Stachybotrys elegans]
MSIPATQRLCKYCSEMTYEALLPINGGYDHIEDIWTLEDTAAECDICHLLLLALLESANEKEETGERVVRLEEALEILRPGIEANGYILPRPCRMVLENWSASLGWSRILIGGKFIKSPDFDWSETKAFAIGVSIGHVCIHSGDEENHAKPVVPRRNDDAMLQHLSACLGSLYNIPGHAPEDQLTEFPTRVLDLGEVLGEPINSPQADLKLVDSQGSYGLYMTLSYCWGGYSSCRTLAGNLAARKEHIAFRDLPAVFQQAVAFTRALGMRYLWIDSLCIIQDDPEDWEREAIQMARIYENGYCRLAVTASRNPTEPFWPPEPIVPSVKVANLKSEDYDGRVWEQYVTLQNSYSRDVEGALLNRRGWVLQERLLSPRSIHFTRNHVYYEDEQDTRGEDGISRIYSWLSCIDKFSQTTRQNLFPEFRGFRGKNYDVMFSGNDSWLKIAEIYSSCHFSYDTDRLIAIAGLVRSKQGPMDDEDEDDTRGYWNHSSDYAGFQSLVGLWDKSLHIDLVWAARDNQILKYLDKLRLPTWSWLAYSGSVVFTKDKRDRRQIYTVQSSPQPEIVLLDYGVPEIEEVLPAKELSFLLLEATLRNSISYSHTFAPRPSHNESRKQFLARSPFNHDERTGTTPLKLPELSRSRELHDAGLPRDEGVRSHIGFISFDDDDNAPPCEQLYLAHISTLRDEVFSAREYVQESPAREEGAGGSEVDPCVDNGTHEQDVEGSPVREEEAGGNDVEPWVDSEVHEEDVEESSVREEQRQASDAGSSGDSLWGRLERTEGRGSRERSRDRTTRPTITVPRPPILAYALVLKKVEASLNEYERVGVAEVNYGWMVAGAKTTLLLV